MKVTEEGTDALFQQYSIQEIQDIERKLRNDIEKKKEDLRQMVGERYQDLISAADTITEMKNSTQSITKHISSMENWCSNIYSEMGPSGILQKCTSNASQKEITSGPVFSLASHLKLLMDVPTLIWSSLDQGLYLRASQILRLAEHVHLSLTLDGEGQFQTVSLSSSFPILAHQMGSIRKFRSYILQQTRRELRNGHVTENELVDIVCSILLLGDASLESIFQEFLKIRMDTIVEMKDSSIKGSTIKDQICELVELVMNTVYLVDCIFLQKENDEQSLLQKTLFSIASQEQPGPIKHFNSASSPAYSCLSQNIIDYHPSLESKCMSLPLDLCYGSTEGWINQVKQEVHGILLNLFRYVTTVKGLSAISDEVDHLMQKPENGNWSILCNNVFQRSFPIYNELLQTVLVDRIKVLCQERIGTSFLECKISLLEILSSLRKCEIGSQEVEANLTKYLWVESLDDIQSLPLGMCSVFPEQALNSGSLAMKASSYTPPVQSLCSQLDCSIGDLLDDMKHFGNFNEGSGTKHNSEMTELCVYVREVLIQDIKKIMQTVQEIVEKNDECDIRTCYPLLSRFVRGLTDLCPNIKSCFAEFVPGATKSSKWDQVKSEILLICDEAFRKWGLYFTRKHLSCVELGLKNLSPASFLQNTLEWDEIEIDEETEEGRPVKSVIRVPMQASVFLTTALFNIGKEINLRIGHVLPRPISQELRLQALLICLKYYEDCLPTLTLLAQDSSRFAQTLALQLLFDIQFLVGFFAVKEQASPLEKANKLIISLEELVDPFDLDVFHPHLQANLSLALQRSTLLLGLLCQERSVSTQRLAVGRNQAFNLLPTTIGVGRFMTLPISTSKAEIPILLSAETKTSSTPKLARGFGSSPSLQSSSSSEPESSSVTKSYSFFSAMGASWFGSS